MDEKTRNCVAACEAEIEAVVVDRRPLRIPEDGGAQATGGPRASGDGVFNLVEPAAQALQSEAPSPELRKAYELRVARERGASEIVEQQTSDEWADALSAAAGR